MYGIRKYWTFLYWALANWVTKEISLNVETIQFNDYDFSDILIAKIPDSYDSNTFDLQTYTRSTHWEGLSNWLIKDKTLTVSWWIIGENVLEMETKIKRIKANLLQGEGTLYLKRADRILQTKAVISNLDIPRETRTINWIAIKITFKILDPFFYSSTITELWFYDISWNFTTTVRYTSWTHSAKPSVFIAFKEAENVSQLILSINNKKLTVNQEIISWDSLSINAEKLDVAKNGKYWIDWIGTFWELKAWENTVWIEVNWEYNAEIFIKYRDTYV